MRASRRSIGACAALVAIVALSTSVSAHRRDEYLQAARIAVEPDHIAIELDLTPGAAVADPIISAIDTDGDGTLSETEQARYARRVVASVSLVVDGRPLSLALVGATSPDLVAAGRGEGTVRVQMRGEPPLASVGPHQLRFANAHLPEHSVYLANALVPQSPRVAVSRQHRTIDQRELTIDYDVATADSRSGLLPLIVTVAFATVVMIPLARRRRA